MRHRNISLAAAFTAALVAAGWGLRSPGAQPTGFKRDELQRHDLSIPGREAVTVRAEFNPGGGVGKHTHPGEEVSYVVEGELTVEVAGQPPVIKKAGDAFFVPAGVVHSARNAGKTPTRVLVVYVLEKGKPLATSVK